MVPEAAVAGDVDRSTDTSLGELVTVPLAMFAVLYTGWDTAFRIFAAFMLLIVLPVGFLLLADRPSDRGLEPYGAGEEDRAAPERRAVRARHCARPSARATSGDSGLASSCAASR